eukprot:511047-Amphidinium_carterae.3
MMDNPHRRSTVFITLYATQKYGSSGAQQKLMDEVVRFPDAKSVASKSKWSRIETVLVATVVTSFGSSLDAFKSSLILCQLTDTRFVCGRNFACQVRQTFRVFDFNQDGV